METPGLVGRPQRHPMAAVRGDRWPATVPNRVVAGPHEAGARLVRAIAARGRDRMGGAPTQSVACRRAVAAALRVSVPGRHDRGLVAGGPIGGGWGSRLGRPLVSWQGVVGRVEASSEGAWVVLRKEGVLMGAPATRFPVTTPGESSGGGRGCTARTAA